MSDFISHVLVAAALLLIVPPTYSSPGKMDDPEIMNAMATRVATWMKATAHAAVEDLCTPSETSFYVLVVVPTEECAATVKTLIEVDVHAASWRGTKIQHARRVLVQPKGSTSVTENIARRSVALRFREEKVVSFILPRPARYTGEWMLVTRKSDDAPRGLYLCVVLEADKAEFLRTLPVTVETSRKVAD